MLAVVVVAVGNTVVVDLVAAGVTLLSRRLPCVVVFLSRTDDDSDSDIDADENDDAVDDDAVDGDAVDDDNDVGNGCIVGVRLCT